MSAGRLVSIFCTLHLARFLGLFPAGQDIHTQKEIVFFLSSVHSTTGKLSHNEIGLDGSLEPVGYGCEGIECGFYTTVVTSGSLTEGSSGSGLISFGE